jgi:hypothetical protein
MFVTFSDEQYKQPKKSPLRNIVDANHFDMDAKQASSRAVLIPTHNRQNGAYTASLGAELDQVSIESSNFADEVKVRKTIRHIEHTNGNAQRRASVARKHWQQQSDVPYIIGAEIDESSSGGFCEKILLFFAWVLLVMFFPFSLFFTLKVVQEYE